MDRRAIDPGSTSPTQVTLPDALLAEASALGVDLSQACTRGLSKAVQDARSRRWLDENRAAMDAWNEYVEKAGLPLAEFRQF